eukprot:9205550-Heterocapsa_arctica.AAC.2
MVFCDGAYTLCTTYFIWRTRASAPSPSMSTQTVSLAAMMPLASTECNLSAHFAMASQHAGGSS